VNSPSRRRPKPAGLLSVLALPAAPFYGAVLAYLIYHPPRRRHHKSPADAGLPSEHVRVPMPGHSGHLDVWLSPGDAGRVVVVGHGIGLSKSASLNHAKFLHDAGYTVALFDHRNHGASSQDRSAFGLSGRFTGDVVAVVQHLRGRPEYRDAKFALYGFSFSTFPVLYVGTRADCPVDAIICDSGPAGDYRPLFRNFLDAKGISVPAVFLARPARPVVESVFAWLGSVMLHAEWPPPAQGRYLTTPLLFLAGEKDAIVPADAVGELARRYPQAVFQLIPDAPHLQGLKTNPDIYRKTVLDFLAGALGS
jgi:uncharacterized protein